MISNLHIKNIGIIDDININLNQGLNILTGETGAGKTLIIDSLNIIAGGRFSKEMIRKGQNYSFVELCLYLPKNSNAIEGNIIISREIYTKGRNLCKINGRLVTVNELKEFMKNIIDIHGQHDNQMLLDSTSHINYIDNFAQKEIYELKNQYIKTYEEYKTLKTELKNNYGDEKEKQRKLDLLKYEAKEISEAKLKTNEEQELEEIRSKIQNTEKIAENLNQADNQIRENAIDAISTAIKALEKIEHLDIQYTEKLNNLKSIYYDIQEISREITDLKQGTYFDEQQSEETEQRLDLIFSLKRKYGNSIHEILKYKTQIEEKIEKIENSEKYREELKNQINKLETEMLEIAEEMYKIRKKYIENLSIQIDKQLQDLEMKNAKILIQIEHSKQKEFNENGLDKIEFLITTNKGEEAKPLAKIASGGEMSRIMLGIKNVLADVDEVPILIFDEIDTGISGIAANSVADKMKQIAKKHQVLCVTHLASIAAKGNYNYYISKQIVEEQTKTNIKLLNEEETIKEIARISSGEITELAMQHAKQLRQRKTA